MVLVCVCKVRFSCIEVESIRQRGEEEEKRGIYRGRSSSNTKGVWSRLAVSFVASGGNVGLRRNSGAARV